MADYFVHESSYVDEGAHDRGRDQDLAFLPRDARCGHRGTLQPGPERRGHARDPAGNNVKVQNNVSIYEGVTLEDDVFCGPSCVFTNVVNPRSHVSRKAEYRGTRGAPGASIGANATIVCGVTLGEYSFIGAGAVVQERVPAFAVMVGVPARRAGWDVPLRSAASGPGRPATCAACGTGYRESDGPPTA